MRFLLACFVLLVMVQTAISQENEAEKLFRAMEKKIRAAKAFEVMCAYEAQKHKGKAELLLTQDNRTRFVVIGHFAGKQRFEVISDGKDSKSSGAKLSVMPSGLPSIEAGGQSEWKTPKDFHASLCTTLTRGGMWYTVFVLPYLRGGDFGGDPDGAESRLKVYDFKLDGTEKIGGREAKIVRYRFGKGDGCKHDEEMKLWLDAETLLPRKRSFTLKIESITIAETYERFTLEPKIAAEAFTLPK